VSGANNTSGERCQQQWRKRCKVVAERRQQRATIVLEAKAREK